MYKKLLKKSVNNIVKINRRICINNIPEYKYLDGNEACSEIAYKMSDFLYLYPITPSADMANEVEKWRTNGKQNIYNHVPHIDQMQSEAGVIAAVHGSLSTGGLTTTFSSSQGLLLMLPVFHLISGQLKPFVAHVAARSLASHSTNVQCDYGDVLSVRNAGFMMISSRTPQECYDNALISHLTTLKSRIPVCHFFDGHQISGQTNIVFPFDDNEIREMIPYEYIQRFKDSSLTPTNPKVVGSSINNCYYQLQEAQNVFYNESVSLLEDTMNEVNEMSKLDDPALPKRAYDFFSYVGDENPDMIIVAMGASTIDLEKTVKYLCETTGEKIGCLTVHVYRPWHFEKFMEKIPESVKKISVLDRTKEKGALGEPLYLDVATSVQRSGRSIKILRGRYGLGGAPVYPNDFIAVYENMEKEDAKEEFTLGINDNVTNLSISVSPERKIKPGIVDKGVTKCVFYGTGSDGTVGSVKATVSFLGGKSEMIGKFLFASGNSVHTAHKAGSKTTSALRYSDNIVTSNHPIRGADYVICNTTNYVHHLPVMVEKLTEGSTMLLNIDYEDENFLEDLENRLPNYFKRTIAEKEARLFVIDADRIAKKNEIPGKINFICLSSFFQITKIFNNEQIIQNMDEAIDALSKHGEHVVESNKKAVRESLERLREVEYPEHWKDLPDEEIKFNEGSTEFVKNIQSVCNQGRTNGIPVSQFIEGADGYSEINNSKFEKRGATTRLPKWDKSKCIFCGACSLQCPHQVIRAFELTGLDEEDMPEGFDFKGKKKKRTIQISGKDCTGCLVCVDACEYGALSSLEEEKFSEEIMEEYQEGFDFALNVDEKKRESIHFTEKQLAIADLTIQNLQYKPAGCEFTGACAGCAESAYMSLLTKLYGHRMIIANATGCSTVFSSYYTTTPFVKNEEGCGPAYGRSLFENAAEYGFGMFDTIKVHRAHLYNDLKVFRENVNEYNNEIKNSELKENIDNWIENYELNEHEDGDLSYVLYLKIRGAIKDENKSKLVDYITMNLKNFIKPSLWIIGGDGWSYDIGFGGLEHILNKGEDFNVFVFDNENYANTGGQSSSSSNVGQFAKMMTYGKNIPKKNLPRICLLKEDVFVGSISINAAPEHTLDIIKKAEKYGDGPSITFANCPCIEYHFTNEPTALGQNRKSCERLAVDSGFWPLYHYDPSESQFVLEQSKYDIDLVDEIVKSQGRFSNLIKRDNKYAQEMHKILKDTIQTNMEYFIKRADIINDIEEED